MWLKFHFNWEISQAPKDWRISTRYWIKKVSARAWLFNFLKDTQSKKAENIGENYEIGYIVYIFKENHKILEYIIRIYSL